MDFNGGYFDPRIYLPYQRNFIFINSERSIGKTYSTQGYILERCIRNHEQFVYIVRTQDEKKRGVFKSAFDKLVSIEFQDYDVRFTSEKCELVISESDTKTLGYCIALSEATKMKKINFPFVRWVIFDEYIVDERESSAYVGGWKEPDLLLKIYHTIDRERDRVIVFMLANAISFFNPYHMHPAFKIPAVERGKIWFSENVLYHWTQASERLKAIKAGNKFLRMIGDTDYGAYAVSGEYINDNASFIESIPLEISRYIMTIVYGGDSYGVWKSENGLSYIGAHIEPLSKARYALTKQDHNENTYLVRGKNDGLIGWLMREYKRGNVRFESMEVKTRVEEALRFFL